MTGNTEEIHKEQSVNNRTTGKLRVKQNNNKQKLEAQKLQTPGYNSELWPTLKKPEFLGEVIKI